MKKCIFYLLISLCFSCDENSSEIDPSIPFYQNLGVDYNITLNSTRIGANFNKYNSEGENLRLPSKWVLFNDKVPTFLGMGTYMYMMSEVGLNPVVFTFTRWKNQVYTNKVFFEDVNPIAIPDTLVAINMNKATVIRWEGQPIGKDEYVQIHLTYDGGIYDVNSALEGATAITMNFTNITSATKGTLYLSRVKKLPLQESNGNAGGKISVSYVQNKEVTFR